MAQTRLIDQAYINRVTQVPGTVDGEFVKTSILEAQDIEMQRILGTKLLNKLYELVNQWGSDPNTGIGHADNAAYKTLLEDFVRPCLARWTLVYLYPYLNNTIENGVLGKRSPEAVTPLSSGQMSQMLRIERDKAQYYEDRLKQHICFNQSDLPESMEATDEDVRRDSGDSYTDMMTLL